jgi:hypothetical protein
MRRIDRRADVTSLSTRRAVEKLLAGQDAAATL